jgi:diguanylate cyclase (GGDEF)-like protein/PAS domain S-box-containing protein
LEDLAHALSVLILAPSDADAERMRAALGVDAPDLEIKCLATLAQLGPAVAAREWDVVLCDDRIEGFDADRALEALRDRSLPLILIAQSDSKNAADLMRRGVADIVARDSLARLGLAVRREVASRRARQAQRATEATLRAHDRLFRSLAANLPGTIYQRVLKPDGAMVYNFIGGKLLTELGIDPEAERLHWPVLAHYMEPDDAESMRRAVLASAQSVTPIDHVFQLRMPSGATKWYQTHANPMVQGDGSVVWDGITFDITERRKAEEALRENEARFKDFAEAGSDWYWEMDAELRFTAISERAEQVTGFASSALIGRQRWDGVDVDFEHDEHWRRHRDDLLQRRPFRNFRYRVVRPSGHVYHICVSGNPLFDEKGAFAGYRGVANDETAEVETRLRAERAEALLRDAVDSISEGFVIYDAEDRLVMCNEAYRRLYPGNAHRMIPGVSFEDVLRGGLAAGQYQEGVGREEEWLAERLAQHADPRGAVEQKLSDGRFALVTERRMRDGGMAGLRIDITALKQAKQAISEREEQFSGIADNLPGVIFRRLRTPDGKVRYTYMSPGIRKLSGLEPEVFVRDGLLFSEIMHPADRDSFVEMTRRSADTLEPIECELRLITAQQGTHWVRFATRPQRLENGDILWDGIALDITDLKETEAHRDYLAYYDQLTGLPNQILFIDRLQQALIQAERGAVKAAVIAIEITSLKDIRDSWGLSAADGVMRQAALRLQSVLRSGDTVAHAGGGNFYILLGGLKHGTDATVPIGKANEIFDAPFMVDSRELYVKATLGVSLYPDDDTSADALLRNAGTALDRAKKLPGHNYEFYNAQMTHHAVMRVNTESELRRAIDHGELEVYYQPQVHPTSYAIIGMEALVRWRHTTRGVVGPSEFITLAEETGLIVPLGEYVMRMACTQTKIWQTLGLCAFPVSVNVSGLQLMRDDLAERVLAILDETGLSAKSLKLELTESTILHDVEAVARTINLLFTAGVSFAVDDFGIEHSALSHLSHLPIDTLKVDHSFVARMTSDSVHAALVQAIISMTHAIHKKAVAEGVETFDELTYLHAYQIDAIQGFLFSPPVPPDEFEILLRAGTLQPRVKPPVLSRPLEVQFSR